MFLNVWATWCGPCVQEMPSIARLADDPRLKGKDIAFVCVSIDQSSAAVRTFLEGRPWRMSFFRAEDIPPVFSTDGIPATYIIAARRADRRIRGRVGPLGYARGRRRSSRSWPGRHRRPRPLEPRGRRLRSGLVVRIGAIRLRPVGRVGGAAKGVIGDRGDQAGHRQGEHEADVEGQQAREVDRELRR